MRASEFKKALKEVQRALECFRDDEPYVHPVVGELSLEELKYLVVDPLVDGDENVGSKPKYTVLPAQQKHHPDFPHTGWSVTVLDYAKRGLVLRVYGTSKQQVENRVRALGLTVVS